MDLEEAEPVSFVDYDQEHPAYYAARSLLLGGQLLEEFNNDGKRKEHT